MVKKLIILFFGLSFKTYAANPWEGSWGEWNKNTFGGTLVLRHCTEGQCSYLLRIKETSGANCSQSGRAEIKGNVATFTPSSNFTGEFKPNYYGCVMKIRLENNSLQAEPLPKSCEAYCTEPSAFISKYKLINQKPFNDDTNCFTEKSPGWTAWCTNEVFMKKDAELLNLRMDAELVNPGALKGYDSQFYINAIADCDNQSDPYGCLIKKYEEQTNKLRELKNSSLKTAEKFEKDFTTPGDVATGDQMISKMEGVYKEQFQNGLVDGTSYKSENILEIVRVSKSSIYFNAKLAYFNGHSCGINGLAQFSMLNKFTYKNEECRLLIEADELLIKLDDRQGTCKSYCGARGSLSKIEFPLKNKRSIKYMERLKNSEAYKNATK